MTIKKGHLMCCRCHQLRPRFEFVGKGRTCDHCKLEMTSCDGRLKRGRPIDHPDYAVDKQAWMRFLTMRLPTYD